MSGALGVRRSQILPGGSAPARLARLLGGMITAAQAKQAVKEWEPTDSQGLPLLITNKLWPEEKKRVVDRALDLAKGDADHGHRRSAERGWSKVKYTVWFHDYWLRAQRKEESLAHEEESLDAAAAAVFAESDDDDKEDEATEPVTTPERRPRTDGDTKALPRIESNGDASESDDDVVADDSEADEDDGGDTDASDDDVNGLAEELNQKCTVEPPTTAHPAACGGCACTVTAAVVVVAAAVSLLRLHTGTEA